MTGLQPPINPHFHYVDAHNQPLRIGQHVEIQHCVGPYGQTQIVTGTLVGIDQYSGITVKVDRQTRQDRGLKFGGVVYIQPGENMYIASVFKFVDGVQIGYDKHVDFEHGHEKWIKILEEQK